MQHRANLYLSRDATRGFVVTVHVNQSGVFCEADDVEAVPVPIRPESLGAVVRAAAARSMAIQRNLRDVKVSDWAVYRTSGTRSIRQFEHDFVLVELEGVNEANSSYLITGTPEPNYVLRVVTTINRHRSDFDLGEMLLEVYKAARDRTL